MVCEVNIENGSKRAVAEGPRQVLLHFVRL